MVRENSNHFQSGQSNYYLDRPPHPGLTGAALVSMCHLKFLINFGGGECHELSQNDTASGRLSVQNLRPVQRLPEFDPAFC